MTAQQSAYVKGFDAGKAGATIDATPYRGHTAGYHRGLANQWRRGCEDGDMAASMLKAAMAKRDKAEASAADGDNAMVRGEMAKAAELWFAASYQLREAAGDMKYHANLLKRRDDPPTGRD